MRRRSSASSAWLAGLLALAVAAPAAAQGCNCFSPEVQAQTAREALQKARIAVHARVVDVDAAGKARLLVLESFKGPMKNAVVQVLPATTACAAAAFTAGEELLLLAFDEPATACDKLSTEHYLLGSFKALQPR